MSLQILPGGAGVGPVREDAQGAPAAPEYPIRALVRADSDRWTWNSEGLMDKFVGQVIMVCRLSSRSYYGPEGENGGPGWAWDASNLIIDPTPEQIAEERAKLGHFADGGGAAPEASEGSPSLPAPTVPKGGDEELIEELAGVLRKVVKWNSDYPSNRIFSEGAIRKIAKKMDDINEEAIAALSKLEGR